MTIDESTHAPHPETANHADTESSDGRAPHGNDGGEDGPSYLRFGAMILTSTAVMFGLTYLNSYTWDHVRWSETRFFMVFYMGAAMALVMLGFMLHMYRNKLMNLAIVATSIVVFVVALFLVRSQTTVQDQSWMRGMIPHHSIAILTSERAEIDDVRVCELAEAIVRAQDREIAEMEWLIDDIAENGPAATVAEAEARAVPDFEGTSIRSCP